MSGRLLSAAWTAVMAAGVLWLAAACGGDALDQGLPTAVTIEGQPTVEAIPTSTPVLAAASFANSPTLTPAVTPMPAAIPSAAATPMPTMTPTPTATPMLTPTPMPVSESDREVLVALYDATDGANWYDNWNWLSREPLGKWRGVDVDGTGRVTRLELIRKQTER